MKKTLVFVLLIAASVAGIAIASTGADAPKGWFMAGATPDEYTTGLDKQVKRSGASSAFVRAKDSPTDFSTLMQVIAPKNYSGKRVKFSAYVKADNVAKWAGLWMRIDGGSETLSFDNMQDRPITGTGDWKQYEVILDVPSNSTGIYYGILLDGKGSVWIDDAKLEVVPSTVTTTGAGIKKDVPTEPSNLNFEG